MYQTSQLLFVEITLTFSFGGFESNEWHVLPYMYVRYASSINIMSALSWILHLALPVCAWRTIHWLIGRWPWSCFNMKMAPYQWKVINPCCNLPDYPFGWRSLVSNWCLEVTYKQGKIICLTLWANFRYQNTHRHSNRRLWALYLPLE